MDANVLLKYSWQDCDPRLRIIHIRATREASTQGGALEDNSAFVHFLVVARSFVPGCPLPALNSLPNNTLWDDTCPLSRLAYTA